MKEWGLESIVKKKKNNKLFLKCLDFTPERIFFLLFDDLGI